MNLCAALACLYLHGALTYAAQMPATHEFDYRAYDINEVENPYETIGLGWLVAAGEHFALDVELYHRSSARVSDHGENAARLDVKWFPFGSAR